MKKTSVGKKGLWAAIVAGFAMFSAFFGAGNLIFPPMLGNIGGKLWWLAFLVFLLTDAGLSVLAVQSVFKGKGSMEDLLAPLSRIPCRLICLILMLVIIPFVIVPRTCATTFELSVQPLLPGLSPFLFSLIFCGIVAALTIRPGSVVDIIGKYLTPILLITLMILCIKGILSPLGEASEPNPSINLVRLGLVEGYQTMDALMALPLGVIIIKSVADKGFREQKETRKVVSLACLVAFAGLFAVYAGLSYLGATTSGLNETLDSSNTKLLVFITEGLLARGGMILLAVIIFLACLTTAIGITSAAADYTAQLTKGKVSYSLAVLLICLLALGFSNLGTQTILLIAEPILALLYPIFLTMVFLSFLPEKMKKNGLQLRLARGAVLAAVLYTLLDLLHSYDILNLSFMNSVPLGDFGLGWILPAIAGGLLGALIRKS